MNTVKSAAVVMSYGDMDMLIEQEIVKQVQGEHRRRWFSDDNFDLVVWCEDDGDIAGFQLCYNKDAQEHALTWKRMEGYLHNRIDAGEVVGKPKSPVLVPDGVFPSVMIAERFKGASKMIDPAIARTVYELIREYR